MMEFI